MKARRTNYLRNQRQTARRRFIAKQAPQCNSITTAAINLGLPFGEAFFKRTNRPARVGSEFFEWKSTVYIFRANVTRFHDITRIVIVLFEPA